MLYHRIVCVEMSSPNRHGHEHIMSVGTGDDSASATQQWTVAEVRSAIATGQTSFYTKSESTGKIASVHPFNCVCGVQTIRSSADAVTDNNLDNMRTCRWRAA